MAVNDRFNGVNGNVAIKAPCRVATTANITLSGLQTIDGVTVVAGDRVLVKDQTTASANGIYEAGTSTWKRAKDFNGNRDVVTGTLVHVTAGTLNERTAWEVSTTGTITIGTSSITFVAAALISNQASGVSLTQGGTVQDAIKWVSPEMFGAAGDGVTNDTVAVQAALDAGTHVYFWQNYLCSSVTVPISVIGLGGPGKLLAASNSATVMQYTADTSRPYTRTIGGGFQISGNSKTGVIGLKFGSVTDNPSAGAQEAVLYVSLRDFIVSDCETGIDSEVSMEHSWDNVVCKTNTVGLKLYSDAVNGGGNANTFRGLRLQGNTVGAMVVSKAGFPVHNNIFEGLILQENTVCGMYCEGFSAAGAIAGLSILSVHMEGNGTGAATATIDGSVVKKSDFHFLRTTVSINDSDSASSLSPSIIAETSSRVVVKNVTGYGNPTGDVFSVDATSVVLEEGFAIGTGTKTIGSYGYLPSLGVVAAVGPPVIDIGQYRNDSTMQNPAIPLLDNTTGVTSVGTLKDADFGICSAIVFDSSAGSTGTNRNYWYMGASTVSDFFILSFLMKAEANTTMRFQSLIGGAAYKTFDVVFENEWKRIVIAGTHTSVTGLELYIYPTDTVGATALFKGHEYVASTDLTEINRVYHDAACGVASPNYEQHTAAPTFGTWKVGEVVWNSASAVGQPSYWQCVTAGTPGTWGASANLA